MRSLIAGLATLCLASACTVGQPSTFMLKSASADATYSCPGGVTDAPYDLHATVDAFNGTSSTVTIKSVNADLTLQKVGGPWIEKVGDRYDASSVKFSPDSIRSGSSTRLQMTIPSSCTSAKPGSSVPSYGDYKVTVHVITSSGSYSITAGNLHRILAD